jgi:rhamnopyranosyl-N-acetylglucosaminyl-diphospho-decaprenol beta-1,3/1,4-galactofuranosyltransferase
MGFYSANSVGAVIVTHNRLTMLQQCASALRQQSRPVNEIIVVDNNSTDGTRTWLAEQTGFQVVLQANLGGAGGFHTGIKTAFERGHDWVWCMDDDGYAAADCLARLLAVERNDLWFRAPLVLARDNAAELAFVLSPSDDAILQTPDQFDAVAEGGLVWDVACPFNGVLIHRQVIQRIGLPLSGMFLWGDESEYCLRAKRAGFKVATMGAARFYHPRDRMVEKWFKFFGRELCVTWMNNPLRDYLAIRNRAYILRHYFGLGLALRHAATHTIFHSKLRGLSGMIWALGAAWAGLRGDWHGHGRYLSR